MDIRITFDRGTLIISGLSKYKEHLKDLLIPLVWDEQLCSFRTEAFRWRRLSLFLSKNNIKYSVHFNTEQKPRAFDQNLQLRFYQSDALSLWKNQNHSGIICLPTGAGKTRIALKAIAMMQVPSLCLVPTRALLEQWIREIKQWYCGDIGQLGDQEKIIKPITVATYASAYRYMPEIGERFSFLIVDEAHHFGKCLQDEALMMCVAPMRMGLTATKPQDVKHLKKLTNLLGNIAYESHISQLSGSYLATFEHNKMFVYFNQLERIQYDRENQNFQKHYRAYTETHPTPSWQGYINYTAKYKEAHKALLSFKRSRRMVAYPKEKRQVLAELLLKHKDHKVLVFTTDAVTAIKVSRDFLIPAIIGAIKKDERSKILQYFSEGRYTKVVSCKVLNEGIDVPDAQVAIILGGSAEMREHAQRIGRILRPYKDKVGIVYEVIVQHTHETRYSISRSIR